MFFCYSKLATFHNIIQGHLSKSWFLVLYTDDLYLEWIVGRCIIHSSTNLATHPHRTWLVTGTCIFYMERKACSTLWVSDFRSTNRRTKAHEGPADTWAIIILQSHQGARGAEPVAESSDPYLCARGTPAAAIDRKLKCQAARMLPKTRKHVSGARQSSDHWLPHTVDGYVECSKLIHDVRNEATNCLSASEIRSPE
jgi:hypothetical protein